jgi:hypothetical protein
MSRLKEYFIVTLIISVLLGILLPLVMGMENPRVIALSFIFVWCISSVLLFVMVFFVEGIRLRQEWKARRRNLPHPPGLFQEWEAFYGTVMNRREKGREEEVSS